MNPIATLLPLGSFRSSLRGAQGRGMPRPSNPAATPDRTLLLDGFVSLRLPRNDENGIRVAHAGFPSSHSLSSSFGVGTSGRPPLNSTAPPGGYSKQPARAPPTPSAYARKRYGRGQWV